MDEIEEYRRMHGVIVYFNKEDSNLFIPKSFGIGFTLNWGNPIAWLLILATIGIVAFLNHDK